VKLSERNVQCPLFGPHVAKTIEREVDAFSNTDSCDTSQQERIGIKAVGPAQFLLKSPIIFRRQRSGKIFRTRRKVLAEDKAGLERMTLEGQVIEQPAKTKQALLTRMVAHRGAQLAKPAEPTQHVGIATEL
jgi:hypothetical protein